MDECSYDAVEAAFGIPDSLCKFCVLKQAVCPGGVEGRHTHIHTAEGKDSSKAFCPEILGCSRIDALERMESEQMP